MSWINQSESSTKCQELYVTWLSREIYQTDTYHWTLGPDCTREPIGPWQSLKTTQKKAPGVNNTSKYLVT